MLKDEARRQGKPFGLLFENIEASSPRQAQQSERFNVMPNVVYRIYTDDRPPELVRGVDLIGTRWRHLQFVAASDRIDVFNGVCGAESGSVPCRRHRPSCS